MMSGILEPLREVKRRIGAWIFPSRPARQVLAARWLRGEGIEIGALHNPLRVPWDVRVRYVDRMTTPELRREFPELNALPLVPVDFVDDGETLATFPDASQDFIIANHFIEHCEDPLRTMLNHFRVLRPGGRLFLAVPDKRFSFDIDRPITPLAHLVDDFELGPEKSRMAHYDEWVRLVVKTQGEDQIREQVRSLMDLRQNIHFHVWTALDFLELIQWLRNRQSLDLNAVEADAELLVVLRKSD